MVNMIITYHISKYVTPHNIVDSYYSNEIYTFLFFSYNYMQFDFLIVNENIAKLNFPSYCFSGLTTVHLNFWYYKKKNSSLGILNKVNWLVWPSRPNLINWLWFFLLI